MRMIGHGAGLHIENPLPAADVDRDAHRADLEIAAFESAMTDWERYRGIKRL